ncbi:hypothetical protein [Streptomyces sp. NPDC049555]|uniref:hypothetical protein n=1 Tax=unclassified Streptomyces TaxID=2593676 RepID=UPI0034141010
MKGIVIVYEFDRPVTAADADATGEDAATPHVVHAAPTAPGSSSAGPRTFCGRDTFDMKSTPWQPSADSWYPPQYADRVCAACDTAMEDEF